MHRAEQIVDAIVALLATDSTIGGPVYKHRALSLSAEDQELPAVSVAIGQDQPLAEYGVTNVAFVDSLLELVVTVACEADTESAAITELFRLRSEVHRTMMAGQRDFSLTTIVIDTRYGGAAAPVINTEGGRLAASLDTRWLVHYRTNISDPET